MDISKDKFRGWLKSKELSENTIGQYLYYLDRFFYSKFDQETVSDYLSKPGNSCKPSRAFLKNLKDYLKVNYDELGISELELKRINSVEFPRVSGRKRKREIKILSLQDIKLLEKYLPSEKEKLKMLLTFYCGLRLEEMVKIRVIDLNFKRWNDNNQKDARLTVIGKYDKQRTIPVPNFLMERLEIYCKNLLSKKNNPSQEELLFINLNTDPSFKSIKRYWQRNLRNAGIKAGITKLNSEGRVIGDTQVYPHLLRHTYASLMLSENLDIKDIQELLGHSSIQSTQIYLHVDKTKLNERVGKIWDKIESN